MMFHNTNRSLKIVLSLFLVACGGQEGEPGQPSQSAEQPSTSTPGSEASDVSPGPSSPDPGTNDKATGHHTKRLTGICIVRDAWNSLPALPAADTGKGYAMLVLPGFHDLAGLKPACTSEIFQTLLRKHCATESTPVQATIATYTPDGLWSSTTCGALGCDYLYCPAPTPGSGDCSH